MRNIDQAGLTLREMYPNMELFLVRIFPHSVKYGPEKTPYLDTFHAVLVNLLKFLTAGSDRRNWKCFSGCSHNYCYYLPTHLSYYINKSFGMN